MKVALPSILDDGPQKRSNDGRTNGMNAKIAAALAAVLLLSACVSTGTAPRSSDQLHFGIWASQNNLWDEAIFRWKKVLQADPRSVAALNNLAVAYEKKGQFKDALAGYEAALKISPDNSFVKSNLKKCKENIQPPTAPAPPKKAAY
jgi:tetratricopeptide (TPR) repeat protein